MGIERTIVSHPDQFAERLFPSLARRSPTLPRRLLRTISNLAPRSRAESGRSTYLRTLTEHSHPFSPNGPIEADLTISATLADVLPESLCARFMLFEPVNGRLTITDVGSGFEIFGETWQENTGAADGRTTGLRLRPMGARHLLPRHGDATAAPGRGGRHSQTTTPERSRSLPLSASHLAVHVQRTRRDMPSWRIGC